MTDKEKEAIEILKHLISECKPEDFKEFKSLFENYVPIPKQNKAIETVLNLIQTQQKEIEKKDKIIDEMAEKIYQEGIIWENKEDVKEYFINKVEKEK